jgi:hypothetical protein
MHQIAQQITQCQQMISQLIAQTQHGSALYQQMKQQELQNAQQLQQLAQREQQAAQMLEQALQSHGQALQQMHQCLQICTQLERIVQQQMIANSAQNQAFYANTGNQPFLRQ